jgi:hypothetical protein
MHKYILMMFIFVMLSMAQNLKFAESIGGVSIDEAQDIIRTSDGGYAIAGYTTSYGAGGYDMIVSKLDVFGKHLWTRVIGGAGDEYAYSLVEADDGDIIIAGQTNSFGAGGGDVMLAKFDADGIFLWAKTIGGADMDYHSMIFLR